MKYRILMFVMAAVIHMGSALAQDPASLIAEGQQLERKYKEDEAIAKFKQVLIIQPTNIQALLKCAELSCSIGGRKAEPAEKMALFEEAGKYAAEALKLDDKNAAANYTMSVVYGKMLEVEEKREKLVDAIKNVQLYAKRAVEADPAFGKAWHVLGRWQFEVLNMSGIKKAAIKVVFGALEKSDLDSAITYMERCRTLEPYYCLNFLDLGRAYQTNKQYEKAIAVLQQLSKLPAKKQDDVAIKAEGALLLQKLQ